MQRDAPRQIGDLLGDVEKHLARVRVLLERFVHVGANGELLRVGNIRRRHDPRTERAGAIEILLADPVVAEGRRNMHGIALDAISRGKIVGAGVARDIIEHALHRHVTRLAPDDHGEFGLPVESGGIGFDPRLGAHHTPRRFDEVPGIEAELVRIRVRRDVQPSRHVVHVVAIIRTGAVNRARAQHRRAQLEAGERHALLPNVRRRRGEARFGRRPILKDAHDTRISRIVEQTGDVVHALADTKAGARSRGIAIGEQAIRRHPISSRAFVAREFPRRTGSGQQPQVTGAARGTMGH